MFFDLDHSINAVVDALRIANMHGLCIVALLTVVKLP
jgi:hypothetical protein